MYTKCYARTYEVRGLENVPRKGPIIFVTNHQNNLPDALTILFASPILPLFVARADLFRKPVANQLLRFLRILPIHRADHGRDAMRKDLPETMNSLKQELYSGGACVIMAEGSSAPARSIRPLKKSWARLANELQTDDQEVHVVLAVMEYSNWQDWGPDMRVVFGKPVQIQNEEADTSARRIKKLNDTVHTLLSRMVADDAEIKAWENEISISRSKRDKAWKRLSYFLLPMAFLLLFPVWLAAKRKVKHHPRKDFKSTLEVGIIGLVTPLWLFILYLLTALLLSWKIALIALIFTPLFLWASARCLAARMHH